MGTYTDETKVRNLYPKLDDVTNLSDKQIEFYVTQAENIINGKISQRYTLPFSSTPPLIESIATEFSLIKLLDRFFTAERVSKNDWRNVRKEDIDKLLEGIMDGSITLVDSANNVIGQSTAALIASTTEDYEPTFNLLDPVLQRVDPDRLQDKKDDVDS